MTSFTFTRENKESRINAIDLRNLKRVSEEYEKIKTEIESCSMEEELKTVWKENSVGRNRLKKYAGDLHAEILSLIKKQKESFEVDDYTQAG